jgi:IS30 family transposase
MTKEPTNPWLDADVELLRKLAADNASSAEISERLGRSVSSVKAKISRLCLPARTRTQKAWAPEEMEQLFFFRDKMRLNWNEIGRRLNRPHSTCYMRYYDFHRKPPEHKVSKEAPSEPVNMERHREWRHRQSLSPVSLTAAIFGDPLPGYSALDRRSA